MRSWTATALLVSLVTAQLWGFTCPSLHHAANQTADQVAHTQHGAEHALPHHDGAGKSQGQDENADGNCQLMTGCSVVTTSTVTTERRLDPATSSSYATLALQVYRSPTAATPTPPPKFS